MEHPDELKLKQPQITLVARRVEGRPGYWEYLVPVEDDEEEKE